MNLRFNQLLLHAMYSWHLAAGLAIVRQPALAAHAGAPYTNVDHRNDRGNDTGDLQIEGLNQGQLDQNYWRNTRRP